MDRAGRQGMMRGAAQEAELHLKQAIAARFVANAPAQASGVVFSGDIAFHYDCLLDAAVWCEPISEPKFPVRLGKTGILAIFGLLQVGWQPKRSAVAGGFS